MIFSLSIFISIHFFILEPLCSMTIFIEESKLNMLAYPVNFLLYSLNFIFKYFLFF